MNGYEWYFICYATKGVENMALIEDFLAELLENSEEYHNISKEIAKENGIGRGEALELLKLALLTEIIDYL